MTREDLLKALQDAIFEGELVEAKTAATQAVEAKIDIDRILKDAVWPAVYNIGESMEEGDFFMPEVKISTKVLLEVASILRPYIIDADQISAYVKHPWTGEGDIDDIGIYLKSTIKKSMNSSAYEQMAILDMIAEGLNTHEFTPCKIQATEIHHH
ncbi:MAG: B12-binding domain-containing protein [Deltaproteobacteria bacterium]|nr:B12-binding domain-containing protein [Deltaproteobacteria bacterium]MBW1958712.1 B12-binding domain-containing protein [Deltaproteobacteria bacterium]